MVTENEGIVYNYEGGTVTTNAYRIGSSTNYIGTVHNFGGEILTNNGNIIMYYSVELTGANTTSTYNNDFKAVNGKQWLVENGSGTITVTPASGYQIDNIDVGTTGATAVKNADGSWTVTVTGIKKNISKNDWELTVSVKPVTPFGPDFLYLPGYYVPLSSLISSGDRQGGTVSGNPSDETPASVQQTKENFDYVYYADSNPDLLEAYGYDEDALWNHYISFGLAEGRMAFRK